MRVVMRTSFWDDFLVVLPEMEQVVGLINITSARCLPDFSRKNEHAGCFLMTGVSRAEGYSMIFFAVFVGVGVHYTTFDSPQGLHSRNLT